MDYKDASKIVKTNVPVSSITNKAVFICPHCKEKFFDNTRFSAHIDCHSKDKKGVQRSPNVQSDYLLAKKLQEIENEKMRNKADKKRKEASGKQKADVRTLSNVQTDYLMAKKLQEIEDKKMRNKADEKRKAADDKRKKFEHSQNENKERCHFPNLINMSNIADNSLPVDSVDDAKSCVKGVTPYIDEHSRHAHNVQRTYLINYADFYMNGVIDKNYGCGYRNLQVLLSSLMRHNIYNEKLRMLWKIGGNYREPVLKDSMPSVFHLQRAIEWAWKLGFDTEGSKQLGGKLYNTDKWIGATEIVALLSALRIQTKLIDVTAPASDGSHPILIKWIANYFKRDQGVHFPLYLQHQDHSRSIIGIEELKSNNKIILLILDPIYSPNQMMRIKTNPKSDSAMQFIRVSPSTLRKPQYQVVSVVGVMNSDVEYEDSKIIKSIAIS